MAMIAINSYSRGGAPSLGGGGGGGAGGRP